MKEIDEQRKVNLEKLGSMEDRLVRLSNRLDVAFQKQIDSWKPAEYETWLKEQ